MLILGFGFHIQIFKSENGLLVPMTGWDFGVLPSSVYCNILGRAEMESPKGRNGASCQTRLTRNEPETPWTNVFNGPFQGLKSKVLLLHGP